MNRDCAIDSLTFHIESLGEPRERPVAPLRHSSPPTGERIHSAHLPLGRPANAHAPRRAAAGKRSGPKKDTLALIAERDELYLALEEANAEVEAAFACLGPFEANWNAACQALIEATDRRLSGVVVPYANLMEMYEARRIAGHARHPHKTRADDASRWRSNVMKKLQEINAEIGI